MEDRKKYDNEVISTPLYSMAFFADDTAKSRMFKMQLFDRSLLMSIHRRQDDGKFELKAVKTCVISQNDMSDLLMLLTEAKRMYQAGQEFEIVFETKKSAFGLFAIKHNGELSGGFALYNCNEGIVVQNAREVVPIINKRRVRLIEADGSLSDKIAPRFIQEINELIGKLTACLYGESSIMKSHLDKFAKKASGTFNREANVDLEDNTTEDDEYPF